MAILLSLLACVAGDILRTSARFTAHRRRRTRGEWSSHSLEIVREKGNSEIAQGTDLDQSIN